MVDGTYKIEANTPMGNKSGTLTLESSGSALKARLKVPGMGTHEAAGTVDGDNFTLDAKIKIFLLGKLDCKINGHVEGDELKARCKTPKGNLDVTGTRV